MSVRTLILIPIASLLGYYLTVFAVPDSASLWGTGTSGIHRVIIAVGFVLLAPTLPFTFAIDLFHSTWAAAYSTIIGTVVAAFFWASVVRRLRRFGHAKI